VTDRRHGFEIIAHSTDPGGHPRTATAAWRLCWSVAGHRAGAGPQFTWTRLEREVWNPKGRDASAPGRSLRQIIPRAVCACRRRPDKLKLHTRRNTRMVAMAETLSTSAVALVAAVAGALLLSTAAAQRSPASAPGATTGDPLAQNFLAEHEIGRRFQIDPADLPSRKPGRS